MNPFLVFLSGLSILGLLFWYFATEIERRKRDVGTVLVLGIAALCLLALRPPSFQKPAPEPVKTEVTEPKPDAADPDADPAPVEEEKPAEKPEQRMVSTLKPGIDLAGGSAYTLRVQEKIGTDGLPVAVTPGAVTQAIKTLEGRLNPNGQRDMLIQRQGTDRIIIEMPGVEDGEAKSIERRIRETAKLELRSVHPESRTQAARVKAGDTLIPGYTYFEYIFTTDDGEELTEDLLLSKRVEVEGKHVKFAAPDAGQKGVVQIRLSGEGGDRMIRLTQNMTPGRDRIAVVLDGEVKSAPVVQSVPLGSQFVIEGLDTYEEANDLSASLMNPLENPLEILEVRQVSARLGKATIEQGIYAGIAGLGLTLVFILLYYRFGGLIALAGLAINILILFGAMAMFEFTFTLPGIAGIILTIGVAVDANVLIYERLREELEGGKSLRAAIGAAYDKAFSAIFDANITTLITALILFWRASGTVKGFAVTLTIGILASMFAALVATRVLFWWGTDTGIIKKLSFMNLIPKKAIEFMAKRKIAFMLSGILLLASIGTVALKREGALGIDFVGGSLIKFQLGQDQIEESAIRDAIKDVDLTKVPIIQEETIPGTGNLISIRCAEEDAPKVVTELRKNIPLLGEWANAETTLDTSGAKVETSTHKIPVDIDQVSATLGSEFLVNSVIALGLGLIAILIYITIRFEFSFAVGAFVALFHDLILCIGFVMLSGAEISLIHVGAFLTIAGYSINDTIVVFDRIREMLRVKRGDVEDVMNIAINSTLSRTLLTSITTFVAVLVLYIFGGPALKDFSFAIMIGVIVGTYSSIFVASPVVLLWSSRKKGSNLRRELLDANLEAQVNPAHQQ